VAEGGDLQDERRTPKEIRIMITKSNFRYIVVLFYQGIGYTLQTDGKARVFFERNPKDFKTIGRAIKAANKAGREYYNDSVYIFKTKTDERLSCDVYKKWSNDEGRVAFKTYKPPV
jgi:hypothetical protein